MTDYIAETHRIAARLTEQLSTPMLRDFSGAHRLNLPLLADMGELDGADATAWNCISSGEQRVLQAGMWLELIGRAASEVDDGLRASIGEALVTAGAYLMSTETAAESEARDAAVYELNDWADAKAGPF